VGAHIVTGAFSYTGRYISERLLADGERVRTLSRRGPPARHPLAGRVDVAPLRMDDDAQLVESLRGASTLFNTYWIRFRRGDTTFEQAIENSERLFRAAIAAGIERIVHISVSNPSEDSRYAYFRGKATVERRLRALPVSSAVIRPTLVFGGREEILVNNMSWCLRHLPLYLIPDDGSYRVQPVSVHDVAELAVAAGRSREPTTIDAAGPDVLSYRQLLELLRRDIGGIARLVDVPAAIVPPLSRILAIPLRDTLVTAEELGALMDELLVSREPPTAATRFTTWLPQQRAWMGRRYASELARNWRS
jgi:NADH dehydrogenase